MTKESFLLEAKTREAKTELLALRDGGRIPVTFYGKDIQPMVIDVDYKNFRKVFLGAGESIIIDVNVDGKPFKALIHDVQLHPITDKIVHADLLHVSMDKPIDAEVPFNVIGVSPAVKDFGGILSVQKRSLKIRCLPKDLPSLITIDVSNLTALHSSIHVKDVALPEGVKAMDDEKITVVTVVAPRKEEEEAAPLPTAAEVTGAAPVAGSPEAIAAAEAAKGDAKKEKK
ncbi:MAG: 50S ribosomal protein L25, large subunit ribosomal protein L25 [Candidatus Peregrinibacteria bacterium GW2011_GWF2_38_29]|nr:MAG: 50S ribosomal protein L25, large subunit ribosomal protein L25 [Candidatus Peregrinibacteria bacterium GW2011_GWF2_38_29]HBB02223.1 50S ribosomal protein L25 [Candidatus Peregrinibacteria bacterium]